MSHRLNQVALLALVLAAGPAGCASSPAGPGLDEPFDLALGSSAVVDDGALTVHFDSVTQDSRCPMGAMCVWAGDGVVRLRLVAASDSASAELHTNTAVGPGVAQLQQYTLELISLAPLQKAGEPPDKTRYTVTLRARRR